MSLPPGSLQDFDQLVASQGAVVQASAASLNPPVTVTLSSGGIVYILLQAWASVGLWLQGLILAVLAASRLNSSVGSDVDTFVADFELTRIASVFSTGVVTIGRYLNTAVAHIPVGLLLTTSDGATQFRVVEDDTKPTWNAGLGLYVIPALTSNADVAVVAVVPGAAGNAQIGTITQISASAPGLDYVSNAGLTSGGVDAETDAQLKARFALYIQSLPRATMAAIRFAVASVLAGIQYSVIENYDYNGAWTPGYVTVVIDDGTGAPSEGLINQVASNVDLYRAATVNFGVFAPHIITTDVECTVIAGPGFTHAAVVQVVSAAVRSFINNLPIGAALLYYKVAQVIQDASPGVAALEHLTLNTVAGDIAMPNGSTRARAGVMDIS